jgi:hypothetical protein
MDVVDNGVAEPLQQYRAALSRWENEGGADGDGVPSLPGEGRDEIVRLTPAELVQLRVRVIALENLVIALLATGSDEQLALVRSMADYISPRPGFTPHALTLQAAGQMVHMADRSRRFQQPPAPKTPL